MKIRILVLDRGFVLVCRCEDPENFGLWLPYTDARGIRVWGTTEGLSQLCKGPTSATRLDTLFKEGKCPVRAIINILEVEQEKWESHLR